jgi:hypothetical protein
MDAETAMVASALTGNGAPSGAHFTLNMIGVDKSKSASLPRNNGSSSRPPRQQPASWPMVRPRPPSPHSPPPVRTRRALSQSSLP